MCNSGSSALYLAVELLGCEPGDEIITSAVTFSTDIAPIVRAGLVPVFVDVEPDTYNIDVDAIEEMIGPRTRAILVPNLIGNAPDWDRIRAIADAHGLQVIEDSCDALGLDAARHADRHPLRHLRHLLRAVAHHHRGRHRRHGAARRRRARRPVPAAAPLGPPLRGADLRFRRRATGASSRESTATSSTTTSSSSTRSAGTSSRPRSAPRSGSCSSTSSPRTSRGASATSTC